MTVITFQNSQYEAKADESVLDVLLRHDIDIPYSCKAGVCNTCVMVSEGENLSCSANQGLKDTLIEQGYFLACQHIPSKSIAIRKADDFGFFGKAVVLQKEFLSENICRLKLRSATDLYYRSGQYINLRMPTSQIRSYSLASLPSQDDYLELHIKRMPNGQMSNWLFDDVSVGDDLDIQGPFGDCYYLPGNPDSNLLMIGTGTGLAPLLGILRDAIDSKHQGQIKLYHGVRQTSELYLYKYLREMETIYKNIYYFPCVSTLTERCHDDIHKGRASDFALANNKELKDSLVYLCGSPQMVNHSRKQVYLNGADMKHIYADPFVTKDLRLGKIRSDKETASSNED